MRKEGLKKDGTKNGSMDEVEIDSAAVEQFKDSSELNGNDAVDPLDGVDNVDSETTTNSKTKGGRKSRSATIDMAAPTSSNGAEITDDKGDGEKDEWQRASSTVNAAGEDEDYEVEDIIGFKVQRKKKMYLVRWKNYGPESDTWEPEASLSCAELIQKYHENNPDESVEGKLTKSTGKANKVSKKKPVTETKKTKKATTTKATKKNAAVNSETYEVDDIIDHRTVKGKLQYLIRWKGYGQDNDTWEPKTILACPEIIKKYNKRIAKAEVKKPTAKSNKKSKGAQKKKATATDDDDDVWEVEIILDEKTEKGKKFYLVRWKGWDSSSDSWEPESGLSCPDLIKKFQDQPKSNKSKKGTKRTSNGAKKSSASNKKSPKSTIKRKGRASKVSPDSDDSDDDFENAISQSDEQTFEVEAIVDHRVEKNKTMYLIKWKNYSKASNTWEPESSLSCPDIIEKYLASSVESSAMTTPRRTKAAVKETPTSKQNKNKTKNNKVSAASAKQNNKKTKSKKAATKKDNEEYEVEEVIDVKYNEDDSKQFLIRWKGCDPSKDTWEPEQNLSCQDLIDGFMNQVEDDVIVPKKKARKC